MEFYSRPTPITEDFIGFIQPSRKLLGITSILPRPIPFISFPNPHSPLTDAV